MDKKPVSKSNSDPRPKAVGQIWGAAIAMLAICIPLCAVLRSSALPFFVIAGAGLATFYIWTAGEKKQESESEDTEALRAKIKELEERLANVEVINNFEERLAEKRLQQSLGSPTNAAPAPPTERGAS